MPVSALSLHDPYVRSFVRRDERLRSAKVLGKGSFCRVLESSDPNRVFKLTTDRAHVAYLVDRLAPQGLFKPVVHADHGIVFRTRDDVDVHLLEIERLQKVHRGTPNGQLVRRICSFVNRNRRALPEERLPTPEDKLEWLPAELAEFMAEVNDFCWNFDCRMDVHWGNFMERADGTLVLSDPVYDYQLFCRFNC